MSHNGTPTNGDEPGTDGDPGPVRYDWTRHGAPSVGVITAVADATGRDPTALPALHEYVDVDALDTLLDGRTTNSVHVTFTYAGTTVVADAGGRITVEPSADE